MIKNKDEILSKVGVYDVVSDFVNLKKSGANYTGLCPFHNERSPSFVVSNKGFYKCFGCGVSGDAPKFLMEYEGLSFSQALVYMANKAGISPIVEKSGEWNYKDAIYNANLVAARLFFANMRNLSPEQIAYLQSRGITPQIANKWHLGLSVPRLSNQLIERGVTPDISISAGLINPQKNDFFRDRLMFPIRDQAGLIAGFGGRTLSNDSIKYLNTPETAAYKKDSVLYGLHQGRKAIRESNEVYIVEGYLDVISMHESGFENTVSASGTSLSKTQAIKLRRLAEKAIVIYDSDNAGSTATLKSIELLLSEGFMVDVVELPTGHDPHSVWVQATSDGLRSEISNRASNFVRYMLKGFNDLPIEKKASLASDVRRMLTAMNDDMKSAIFAKEAASIMGIDSGLLEINAVQVSRSWVVIDRPIEQRLFPISKDAILNRFRLRKFIALSYKNCDLIAVALRDKDFDDANRRITMQVLIESCIKQLQQMIKNGS